VTLLRKDRPARRGDVWLRRVRHENTLYDPVSGSIHLLNDTAVAIWDLCDGETSPSEMIAAVCEVSGLPREVAAEDIDRILRELDEAHLIAWMEDE